MSWPVYPKYKDTVGSDPIPDHWKLSKLRHLLKVNPSVPESLRSDGNEMVTFLPMEAVGEDGTLDTTRERPIRELLTGYSYFANGDVIMAKVTPCFENGKAAVIERLPTTDGFGTSEVTTLRPGSDLDQRFLGYLVRSDRFRQSSIAAMTGAGGLKRVPDEHVRSFEIGLPSDAEQYGIVAFLDRETAKIDALIAKQEQLIATLREDRAATITQAVTKGLDPDVEMKDSGVDWVDEIPASWRVMPLLRCVEGRVDYRGATPKKVETGIVLITARNVRPGMIDYSASEEYVSPEEYAEVMRRGTPEVGDLLFTMEAPLGNVALVDRTDIALAQRIIKFRADRGITAPRFLMYSIMSGGFQSQLTARATGSTALGLKASKLPELRIAVAPVDEQVRIVEFLDTHCNRIDALMVKSTEVIETLREYRSALITDAVTGKIDVRGVA